MKVPIENMSFEESGYKRGREYWKAQTLYDFVKAKGYKVMLMPLWNIDLTNDPFVTEQIHNFVFQMRRTLDTDLKYPIILDNYGQIADGWHRICKALLEGKETIKAIRMLEMPAPDEISNG